MSARPAQETRLRLPQTAVQMRPQVVDSERILPGSLLQIDGIGEQILQDLLRQPRGALRFRWLR
eukprot:134043-Heterocapsa_arctica.AAC.1